MRIPARKPFVSQNVKVSRKSATIFDQGTIPEASTPHIGKGVALVALTATLVYIYARISQIAVNRTSFYATQGLGPGEAAGRV